MRVSPRRTPPRWPAPLAVPGPGAEGRFSRAGAADAVFDVRPDPVAVARWREDRERARAASLARRILRKLWQRCNRLHAPVIYPWSAARHGDAPVPVLRRAAAAVVRECSATPFGTLWRWTKAAVWPGFALAAIVPLWLRFAREVAARQGRSRGAQLADLARAAWRHGIFPTEYYHHRVFRGLATGGLERYLNDREIIALLWAAHRGVDTARIDDGLRFLREARAAGLPVPRGLAVFRDGDMSPPRAGLAVALPERDLFLRPATWDNATAGEHWRWHARTRRWMHRDRARSAEEMLQHGCALGEQRPWLLQESINNHPDIGRFSAGGLCSVEIVTGIDDGGAVVPLFARLHLPAAPESGWGKSAGELTAGIDLADGRLHPATGEFIADGEFAVHPGTGVTLAGTTVPEWAALGELVRRAHGVFAEVPFVAWRVALAGRGPVLLEAATGWEMFHHVWPADTAFAELCLRRLERGSDHERGCAHGPGHPPLAPFRASGCVEPG